MRVGEGVSEGGVVIVLGHLVVRMMWVVHPCRL